MSHGRVARVLPRLAIRGLRPGHARGRASGPAVSCSRASLSGLFRATLQRDQLTRARSRRARLRPTHAYAWVGCLLSAGLRPSVTGAGDVPAGSLLRTPAPSSGCARSLITPYQRTVEECLLSHLGLIVLSHRMGNPPIQRSKPLSSKPYIGLASRTGSHLYPRGPTVLQHQFRRPSGAGHVCVDQEALRADPVSGQVEVVQACYPGTRSTGETAFSGSWERANGLDTWQVLSLDQRSPPSRLRRVEQVFEITLVLARVPWMPRIELLEGDNQGRPFGSDARVDGLGAHEPRTVEVLYYRTVRYRQTAQGNVEAGDARRDQAVHDPAHGRVLSPIHQLCGVPWACRNDDG